MSKLGRRSYKICSSCNKEKHKSEFGKDGSTKDKRSYECLDCKSVRDFKHRLNSRYGISIEQYEELLRQANYQCEICQIPVFSYGKHLNTRNRACIDHDHQTKLVRGILCQDCNFAVGLLKNEYTLCLNAAKYLKSRE